jgi:hypothetical protein
MLLPICTNNHNNLNRTFFLPPLLLRPCSSLHLSLSCSSRLPQLQRQVKQTAWYHLFLLLFLILTPSPTSIRPQLLPQMLPSPSLLLHLHC